VDELQGRSALVTGAARRIGRAIALGLARAGANVAITYLQSNSDAERTRRELEACGVRALAIPCDVRDEKSVQTAVRQVVRDFGRLDLLVNNAALYQTVELEKITVAQWDDMFATNTRGPFLVSRAALKALQKSQGRIINIGSLGGARPWAEHAHYCASKAALVLLTAIMAKAWAPHVAVNCVAPGMIRMSPNPPSPFLRRIAAKTPMQRAGAAADVVDAVLFFAAASKFITGQTLLVDGGLGLTT
jgi:3-oxoacyl-[acyl-carrier protein] reductase/pteridine reductase